MQNSQRARRSPSWPLEGDETFEVSDLARAQIRAAEAWWRVNRPKAPNAIREELERASLLISVQADVGARARNTSLAGIRRLHPARVRYYVYYRVPAVTRIRLLPMR